MNQQQRTLLSGIALGTVLGLILGHFSLWKPGTSAPSHNPFAGTARAGTLDPLGRNWEYSGVLSDLTGFDTSMPLPRTAELPDPLRNAIDVHQPHAAVSASNSDASQISKTRPQTVSSEPAPILIADASPIPPRAAAETGPDDSLPGDSTLRTIIEKELQEIPAGQREIWYEALQGVQLRDVPEILQMWKLLGGPQQNPGLQSIPHGKFTVPQPERGQPDLAAQRRALHHQNLQRRNTPGSIRLVPRFVEQTGPDGLNVIGLEGFHDLECWSRETGFPLDLSLVGQGFFALRDSAGELYLTRSARFCLDSERRIVLQNAGTTLILQPEMRLPEDPGPLTIDAAGIVTAACGHCSEADRLGQLELVLPLTPVHLVDVGNGLYHVPELHFAEMIMTRPASTPDATTVAQGKLSFPVVSSEGFDEALPVSPK